MNIDAIKNEIVRYGDADPFALQPAILSNEIALNKYAKPLGKVKGNWSFPSVFMGRLVQAFSDKWTPYGEVQFRNKVAKNFHQKVNFEFNPYDIYGSWREDLYHEEKTPAEMPISKYVVDMLAGHITSDLAMIHITGDYDAAQVGDTTPDYTKTMDGLNVIINQMVADTTNPAFLIPIDAALANDVVKRVDAFERGLPQGAKVDVIVLSLNEFYNYVEGRENPTIQPVNYQDGYRYKSKYGREIVGIPGRPDGQITGWVTGNLFRLYDRKDNPATIDDVQVQDYVMKVFIQWHLGYDFAVNQYVFVETADALKKRGLNNAAQNELYFPNEIGLTV